MPRVSSYWASSSGHKRQGSVTVLELTVKPDVQQVGFGVPCLPPEPVVIKKVTPGTWADHHGLHSGDILMEINSFQMQDISAEQFAILMKSRPLNLKFIVNPLRGALARSKARAAEEEDDDDDVLNESKSPGEEARAGEKGVGSVHVKASEPTADDEPKAGKSRDQEAEVGKNEPTADVRSIEIKIPELTAVKEPKEGKSPGQESEAEQNNARSAQTAGYQPKEAVLLAPQGSHVVEVNQVESETEDLESVRDGKRRSVSDWYTDSEADQKEKRHSLGNWYTDGKEGVDTGSLLTVIHRMSLNAEELTPEQQATAELAAAFDAALSGDNLEDLMRVIGKAQASGIMADVLDAARSRLEDLRSKVEKRKTVASF
eukprot:TRINITY_DN39499_c0_g1_i1.p1 TRINITY_DN39499_c0_g1~~TRINITY_DN39499_c0_g1_i1.p1  ORF type:complete len:373 (+),score=97.61 TRINITY_DN39499_c0_g1_i1:80-1198(+)